MVTNKQGGQGMSKQNWNATDYAEQSSAQFKWANEMIEKMDLLNDTDLLDIGCGDGKITALLSKKCPNGHSVGIDSSQDMVDKAKTCFNSKRYPNLSFQKNDARKLPFKNKFDLVFSNSTLHWIKDHSPILKGIYLALKPNGKIYLKFGGKGTLDSFQPMIDSMLSSHKWKPYFKSFETEWGFFDDQTYSKWLKKSGLTPIIVKLTPSNMVHENPSQLEGWVRTTWHPYLQWVPENHKNDFITELVSRYLEKHPVNSQGKTNVKMIRLEIEAKKEGL